MEIKVIQNKIFELRGLRVMLDFDLAELYQIETKYLKRAVKANIKRFPNDFMFELTKEELLRCNFSTSKRGGNRYLPFAFTEHGITMLASILNSDKAIEMNISIVRAFIALRQMASHYSELENKIKALEKKYNRHFKDIYEALQLLMEEKRIEKESEENWKNRQRIGFKK